ncbi:GH36-type glycosyl hydrolase domain-containing protein [Sandarakinorhabdus sp.]|uniref:GH36-type glycosyl hydrolase domain-containing protein n=1 Tax=Sandarakinorhabdus sp. TaxID=1916663 RepID=UPI00286E0492|nr:glucoamylase family protein [Sandarakinorhabdus sp.]
MRLRLQAVTAIDVEWTEEHILRPAYFRPWKGQGSAPLEPPVRAELFSIERLEAHARSLAASQQIVANPRTGRSLGARLDDNSKVLTAAYRAVAAAAAARQVISPAASWLLDNFHIVDEQLRQIRNDLPPGFYRRLPKLADGPLKGYPRVFGISWDLVAHTDSAFDAARIVRFLDAYQSVQPLDIGELWALAITLRITLVENLRRLAEAILAQQAAGLAADVLAGQIFGAIDGRAQSDDEIIACLDAAPWSMAFAVELAQRLRHEDPGAVPASRWLNDRLTADGATSESVMRDELNWQSATDVTVRNVITSMRLVSMLNWSEVFETISPVDAVLGGVAGGSAVLRSVAGGSAVLRGASATDSDFAAMDFQSRDHYRRAVEQLARQSRLSEVEVATRAIAAAKGGTTARQREPGYYLISNGRPAFERALGCRIPLGTSLLRLYSEVGILSYIAMIAALAVAALALALWATGTGGLTTGQLVILALVGIVPASDIAVAFVNRSITRSVGGRLLPALELRGGITSDLATIIVIPALLVDAAGITEQIDRLEDHYLGNPDDNFNFALISDWLDAATEHHEQDQALLDQASAEIARLNALYGLAANGPRFTLLHRKRVWNQGEGRWIGWERKRGKLRELNRLLRGAKDTSFMVIGGLAPWLPPGIRYVITLDVDTRMPMGTARRLVGKMAHPLNRPEFDQAVGLVVRGHGMLQPRVTPSLPTGSDGSLYQRVFSGPNGLDPYALAVSDVYQDLFEEGSFTGKGIYEVDSFEAALKDQFPDSAVLSHDLLEGIFARATLASDIEVVEEFPSRYAVAAARQHRWVRGDWQLLPWILGLPRHFGDTAARTRIPLMGRWKLLDNLRRSLSAPAGLLALLIGWLLPRPAADIWTSFIVLTIVLPPLLPAFGSVLSMRSGVSLRSHARSVGSDFALGLQQASFLLVFLAHQAWLMVDAVGRTLLRVFVHRRHLLQWVSAAQSRDDHRFDTRRLAQQVAAIAVCAIGVAALIEVSGNQAWPAAAPFLLLWTVSPLIAWRASQPPRLAASQKVTPADDATLRLVARRTWRFFETFMTHGDNMLPPDNFQETPRPVVAHRTSPTNIGLYLLSVIAARDFGWIGTRDVLVRLEDTFDAMDRLERFHGHLFNWYDTTDLRALEPRYVSSVDSGNLAGHLLALRNACIEIAAGPAIGPRWQSGTQDCAALLAKAIAGHGPAGANADLLARHAVFSARLAEPAETTAALSQKLRSLVEDAGTLSRQARLLATGHSHADASELLFWAEALEANVMAWHDEVGAPVGTAQDFGRRLARISERAKAMFDAMEFGFLFDADRQLLSIGYNCADAGLDGNFYDLLASEARLASFVAIAKGDVPAKHWFRLGRTLTPIDGSSGLISWSGSMFEYLMPSLVMRAPAGSLLAQTNALIVWRQRTYAQELGSGQAQGQPWGISESQFNVRDIEQTYQYSSFGVPDLGYKRGLGANLVIAPYASGLASMVDPAATARNFRLIDEIGASGAYGCYEAIDYTRARLPDGAPLAIVRAFMAHHQAMIITGIGNALHHGAMRTRFHAEPIVRAAELLLQERMPRDFAQARAPFEIAGISAASVVDETPDMDRRYTSVHSRIPRTHLLSNGHLSTMITAAGSGYCRWNDVAVTRWREDATCDDRGAHVFVRDTASGAIWSPGYQPTITEPDHYEVAFSQSAARIARTDGDVTTVMDVVISPEEDSEVRRISITNNGKRPRVFDVTSYVEIVLARQADDAAHPAFGSLFVETEFVPQFGALLANRRRRSGDDPSVWAAQLSVVEGETTAEIQFETDRAKFIGRGKTIRAPLAVAGGWPLSNTAGLVLDPIFSLRRQVRVLPGATVRVSFWTLVAASREDVLALADKHQEAIAFERAATLAWTQAQMELHHLGIDADDANRFQRLASHVIFSDPAMRAPGAVLAAGAGKASQLWPAGISGDLPIVLVRINDDSHLALVRHLLQAHEYWRLKQMAVDLVILNERSASYAENMQAEVEILVAPRQPVSGLEGGAGRVFALRADLLAPPLCAVLESAARAVLHGDRGSLADQLRRAADLDNARLAPQPHRPLSSFPATLAGPLPPLEFFNGLGGFADNGREYLTILDGDRSTPAPWVNVIANPSFGFQVSVEGSGFTWAGNSQLNQLTPWSNDPVCDPAGEAFYIRDDETGGIWTPTALPIRDPATHYIARHGQGYSRFEHAARGVALDLIQYVPVADSIKVSRLRITNTDRRPRTLTVTAYAEWVLGRSRSANAPHVVTEVDPDTGAIFARNSWNDNYGDHVAFADLGGRQTALSADRGEFLGRSGAMDRPRGLAAGTRLSGRVGAGLDPCAALQVQVRLEPGASTEIVCFLGQAASAADARALLAKYRVADQDAVLAEVKDQWDDTLGTVQVTTPDRALDIMVNRWLPYQTLACRVWARSGFYQSSGAYGFRDQLQDVLSLCVARPEIARAHLLRAAGRQFREGDVQHWWLPETGRGIRTRVSDDRAWLGYAVSHYVEVSGDVAVLDEVVPFLEGPALDSGAASAFFLPEVSVDGASLFDHAALALDASLDTGMHGLPLMGTGDWNDGMDAVGAGGQGESIWLGWFHCAVFSDFAVLAERRGRPDMAARWRRHVAGLRVALDTAGWDGDWYRRAYFDDGTALGSVSDRECRIDSIAQSWSVISGAAEPPRAARAMAALDKYLVRRDDGLVLLFDPPFDKPVRDPGYIKGYPPGVRENGGQYTHAAAWAALAFARQGDGDRAGELLAMLNPIRHSDSPGAINRYRTEPYVVAADVYSQPPHVGRGGWTWYTGSAAWISRVTLEALLGFCIKGAHLHLDPCIPRDWPGFEIAFRRGTAQYRIIVENPHGLCRGITQATMDGGSLVPGAAIALTDDGASHVIRVTLGA